MPSLISLWSFLPILFTDLVENEKKNCFLDWFIWIDSSEIQKKIIKIRSFSNYRWYRFLYFDIVKEKLTLNQIFDPIIESFYRLSINRCRFSADQFTIDCIKYRFWTKQKVTLEPISLLMIDWNRFLYWWSVGTDFLCNKFLSKPHDCLVDEERLVNNIRI